jgi:hypothetical protein
MTDQSPRNHSSRKKPTKKTPTSLQPLCHGKPRRLRLCMTRLMTHKTPKSQNRLVGNGVFYFY